MKLEVGAVYEIRHRLLVSFDGVKTPECEFLKLIGFSSRGYPVFEVGNKYEERGGDFQDIIPLQQKPEKVDGE